MALLSGCSNRNKATNSAYIIYYIIKKVFGNQISWYEKADALKVLEDVKLEYFDKVLKPHGKIKQEINGDV